MAVDLTAVPPGAHPQEGQPMVSFPGVLWVNDKSGLLFPILQGEVLGGPTCVLVEFPTVGLSAKKRVPGDGY